MHITIPQSPKWRLQVTSFVQTTQQDSSLTITHDKEKQQIVRRLNQQMFDIFEWKITD